MTRSLFAVPLALLTMAASVPSMVLAAVEYATDESCDAALTSPVALGCSDDSGSIGVDYGLGDVMCGAALTISQAAIAPRFQALDADADSLYTLLLVDTTAADPAAPFSPHPILHFGAVNIPGGSLIGGISLNDAASLPEPFLTYRGPNPPPATFVPGIESQAFNYEYMLAAQDGMVDNPLCDITNLDFTVCAAANFDFTEFLASNTVGAITSTYFSSGYCAESTEEEPSPATPSAALKAGISVSTVGSVMVALLLTIAW